MQKSLVVIQSRYASTRLPGKALYPFCKIPMLVFLGRRLRKLLPDSYELVLATTERSDDDALALWAEAEGIPVIRGPVDDVLGRYLQVCDNFSGDAVVRVTGDNPLTDARAVIGGVNALFRDGVDYVDAIQYWPVGTGVDVFHRSCLLRVDSATSLPRHREHINAFILDHPERFSTASIVPPEGVARPDISLTVDTMEEYRHVLGLMEYKHLPDVELEDVIARIDQSRI